jgi:hypothetical protein
MATRAFLNHRLDGIGEVELLSIDTAAQSLQVRLGLQGERSPVEIDVKRYLLHTSADGASVTVVDASASRPWIDHGLHAFVVGRPMHIPTKLAFALKMLT